MESFLGTIVFIIPGLFLYFWLHSFGIYPVVKHTPAEFTAVVAMLWIPVSLTTLLIYNLGLKIISVISSLNPVLSIGDLKAESDSLLFLGIFIIISIVVSFTFGVIWSKWLQEILNNLINIVRRMREIAPLSKTPTVWDEVFLNNDAQVVEIGKIDKPNDSSLIGCIKKVSRPFETERNIHLEDVDFFTELIMKHKIPVINVFYDVKSGTYVKIFDYDLIIEAQNKDLEV